MVEAPHNVRREGGYKKSKFSFYLISSKFYSALNNVVSYSRSARSTIYGYIVFHPLRKLHKTDIFSRDLFQKLVNEIYAETFGKLPHTLRLNPLDSKSHLYRIPRELLTSCRKNIFYTQLQEKQLLTKNCQYLISSTKYVVSVTSQRSVVNLTTSFFYQNIAR
jgi:hypothetical protein